jgi:hypothetical protein
MTRNNARIIAKYLREAGWSEVTALRQELAASKARVQEMGRHNATEAEHFRAICRRIEDWVSIMTTGHAVLSAKRTNSAEGVIPSRAELIKPSVNPPNSAKKVSNINARIAKVSTTRRWLGGERSFLAR